MLTKYSTKFTQNNVDNSAEFIFDDSEEKIDAKILWNEELCECEHHKLTAKTSLIAKRFNKVILSLNLFIILQIFVSWEVE